MWMSIIRLQWHRFLVVHGLPIIIFRAPRGGVNLLLQKRSCYILVDAVHIVFQITIIQFFDLKKKRCATTVMKYSYIYISVPSDGFQAHIRSFPHPVQSSFWNARCTKEIIAFQHKLLSYFPVFPFHFPPPTGPWCSYQPMRMMDDDDGIWSKL